MKRTKIAQLLLMSGVPILLAACDNASESRGRDQSFTTVAQCEANGNSVADCQRAYDTANANAVTSAPRFQTLEACEQQFDPASCQPRHDEAHGSFFGPMLAGFMLSQMINNGSSRYASAQPLYRQRYGGYYQPYASPTSSGGYGAGYFGSGAHTASASSFGTRAAAAASDDHAASGTRAITASRGGFGSMSAARGGWGG